MEQEADGKREADGNKEVNGSKKHDGSSVALLDLHEYLYKKISCTPRLTRVKGILVRKGSCEIRVLMRSKERILRDTCINEDLSYRERPFLPRNECQLYTTIKTPKLSQTKVRIIYPSSGTLEL